MRRYSTFRSMVLLALLGAGCAHAQRHRAGGGMGPRMQRQQQITGWRGAPPQRAAAPIVRQAPPPGRMQMQQRPAPIERRPPPRMGANGSMQAGHLAEWMSQHRNLSTAQQQQAMQNEPGFRELPPRTQQRVLSQLATLNAMPPQQRERWTQHTEALERLTPGQRSQFRNVMQQLGSLPPEQRRVVARSFRQLRQLPPEERRAAMNSDFYQFQMNNAQRATLNNLMRIEPLIPPDEKPGR